MKDLEHEVMIARIDNRINAVLSFELYLAKLMSRVLGRSAKEVENLDDKSELFVTQLREYIKKEDEEFNDILKTIDRRD